MKEKANARRLKSALFRSWSVGWNPAGWGVALSLFAASASTLVAGEFGGIFITCPADVTVECDQPTDPGTTGVATVIDDCFLQRLRIQGLPAEPSFFDEVIPGNCPLESVILREWSVFNDCENSDFCTQQITVVDSTPPVITAPADVTFECDELGNEPAGPGTPFTGFATATDNCDQQLFISSSDVVTPGACPQESVTVRTWTATDACGNQASAIQTITIQDTTPPFLAAPPDVTVECDEDRTSEFTGFPEAFDSCDFQIQVNESDAVGGGDCPQGPIITRTWTATDACGNQASAIQIITVQDTTPPVITCPADTTIGCNEVASPGVTGIPTAEDNCDNQMDLVANDSASPGQCFSEMIISRVWAAIDDCGNSATCTQIITVADISAPDVFCPPDVTVGCGDPTDPEATGFAEATDDCQFDRNTDTRGVDEIGGLFVNYEDEVIFGECEQEQTINRTWSAVDDCGNTGACVQVITVVDSTPPEVSCDLNSVIGVTPIQVLGDGQCVGQVPDLTGGVTAEDDCGGVTVTQSPAAGTVFTNTVAIELSATDDCGNVGTTVCPILIECNLSAVCQIQGYVYVEQEEQRPSRSIYFDQPLSNVTVRLVNDFSMTVVQTVTTDVSGVFTFAPDAPGSYRIEIDEATLPAGYALSYENPTASFFYDPLSPTNCPMFFLPSFLQCATCGLVWADLNGNGIATDEDLALTGLNNVIVNLYDLSGNLQMSWVTTNGVCSAVAGMASVPGVYTIPSLPPGDWVIEIDASSVAAALEATRSRVRALPVDLGFRFTTGAQIPVQCPPVNSAPNLSGVLNAPTAVELAAFGAERTDDGVRVQWTTAMELDNLGFNLYRAESIRGTRTQVNDTLVLGQGTGDGADYHLLDAAAPAGTLYYWLEDLDWAFVTTVHGPVIVAPVGPGPLRILQGQPGDPIVLWSKPTAGTEVIPQYSLSLDPVLGGWLPVPGYQNTIDGDRLRTEILPLSTDPDAMYFRLIQIAP